MTPNFMFLMDNLVNGNRRRIELDGPDSVFGHFFTLVSSLSLKRESPF